MNPAFFDLQGNPIGAYAEYINMIMHYKDSFYRLYFMMTGVNLNLLSHIGINSFLTDLKFVDLEEVLLVRDFISTFLTTVDGILGNEVIMAMVQAGLQILALKEDSLDQNL